MLKHLHKIIILGAVWGITEATVGYFLHMFAAGLGWALWFPIAFFFINKSYRWMKSFSSVMMTAVIASSLKLINLFFPVRIDMVFNPAVSIILEALSVILVYHFVMSGKRDKLNVFDILLIGFAWRAFYLTYVFLLPQPLLEISPAATALSFSRFMFFENAANSALIYAGLLLAERLKCLSFDGLLNWFENITERKRLLKPVFCSLMFVLAVILQLVTV